MRKAECMAALTALLLMAAACRREEKPPVRTEPWPAPGVSGSAHVLPGRASYVVTRGKATLELRVEKRRVRGELDGFTGELDVDFDDPRRTRGRIRADLRSLTLEGDDGTELAREVFARLGLLGADDEHRYAELVLEAIEPRPRGSGFQLAAQGALTMHGFRVPVVLELSVDRSARGDEASEGLRVRTRRPLSVPLAAYGLAGETRPENPGAGAPAFGREVAVSAEVEAEPAPKATAR